MVREIMRDVFFLAQKSEPATEADLQVARDLLDTLEAYANECVGMAANMIGMKKQIIAVNMGLVNVAMLNPADYSVAPEAPVRNFEQQLSGRNSSALR